MVTRRAGAGRFLSSLGRFARRRRPKTHGTLARVHLSHGTGPPPWPAGTLHLSLWKRQRSQDDRMDWSAAPGGGVASDNDEEEADSFMWLADIMVRAVRISGISADNIGISKDKPRSRSRSHSWEEAGGQGGTFTCNNMLTTSAASSAMDEAIFPPVASIRAPRPPWTPYYYYYYYYSSRQVD